MEIDDNSTRLWVAIAAVTRDLVKFPESRAYLLALAGGDRPAEHPRELLTQLRALFAEHGERIVGELPDELRSVDWNELCSPAQTEPAVSKIRRYLFERLYETALYTVERYRARVLVEPIPPATKSKRDAAGSGGEAETPVTDDAWLGHAEIAHRFGVNPENLRQRLNRLRKTNHDCYREVAEGERKSTEPKYLYRLSSVKPIIDTLATSDSPSASRPANVRRK